ncbi:MAG: 3-deoxy-D-manno-octulosonic acid kinase [Gammaproteobacteria bacterium]|nr:3-deoxy-D-manno-octulosonic acid kinase [Gammaproteobacteria bacterium]
MTNIIIPAVTEDQKHYILYDAASMESPSASLFKPDWLAQHGEIDDISAGRGAAWFINYKQQQWVLRHYRRGGLVARLINDTYLGFFLNRSRSWREWKLLHKLYTHKLPVPRPVAASVKRMICFYTADIIVETIPDTETLAKLLCQQQLDDSQWQNIGATIRQFHDFNLYHADLNAHNILLNKERDVFIIDFDRGRIRNNGSWKSANLQRLQRSLNKLNNMHNTFNYSDHNWQALLTGYDLK